MSQDKQTSTLWGGRFTEATDAFVQRFTASVNFDQRMYKQDIAGSIAHATMLETAGVLSSEEKTAIINGLTAIQQDIDNGQFEWSIELEDVHMNIESALTKKIGVTGKKLHTGRSRNDQVATDIRLYLRDEMDVIANELTRLQKGILDIATREADTAD
jgi:argininosuccinate lyase